MDLSSIYESQVVFRDDYNGGIYQGRLYGTFGVAGLELIDGLAVELVFQVDYTNTWANEIGDWDFYAVLPDHDWDASYWYWLAGDALVRPRGSNQLVVLLGPGMSEWTNAMAAGETGLLVDTGDIEITGFTWRYVPAVGPQGGLTPGDAPLLPMEVVSEGTPPGTSNGPGLRFHDEVWSGSSQVDNGARWWRVVPEESGWYEFNTELTTTSDGLLHGATASVYVFDGVPGEADQPMAFSSMSRSNYQKGVGLVELTAGRTYYFKVMRWGTEDSRFRLFVQRATWFCGGVGPDPRQAVEFDPEGFNSGPVASYALGSTALRESQGEAWWTFVAPRSGPFKVSAMLSMWPDTGALVNQWWLRATIWTNDEYWTGSTNPLHMVTIGSFDGDYDDNRFEWLTEGQRYWVSVAPYYWHYRRPIVYVLQATYVDHEIVELENKVVLSRTDGNIAPSVVWNSSLNTNIHPDNNWGAVKTQGFQGYMEFWRSFGGPQPGESSQVLSAFTCMWNKAKYGQAGTWWYSKYNGVEWDGGEGGGGFGNCPVVAVQPGYSEQGYWDAPVGWHWHSEGGTYGEAYLRVWCHSQGAGLHQMMEELTQWAGLSPESIAAQVAAVRGGGGSEQGFVGDYTGEYRLPDWNSSVLVKLEVAPDEQGSQWANPHLAPPTEWYVSKMPYHQYEAPTGWGPSQTEWTNNLRFSGGPGGPIVATGGDLVATYSGGSGAWVELDWQEYWDYEEEVQAAYGYTSWDYVRGLLFTAINDNHKQDAVAPPPPMDSWSGPSVDHYAARLGQVLCLRLTVKTKPLVVTFPTPFPGGSGAIPEDCGWEWETGGSIEGDVLDERRLFTRP